MKNKVFKKIIIFVLSISLSMASFLGLVGCAGGSEENRPLATPANVIVNDLSVSWDTVSGSVSYSIFVNTTEFTSTTNSFSLTNLELSVNTPHFVAVRANALNPLLNSGFSVSVQFTIVDNSQLPPEPITANEWYAIRNATIDGLNFYLPNQQNYVAASFTVGLPTNREILDILTPEFNPLDPLFMAIMIALAAVDTAALSPSIGLSAQTYDTVTRLTNFINIPHVGRTDTTNTYLSIEDYNLSEYLFAYLPLGIIDYIPGNADFERVAMGLERPDGIYSPLGTLSYHGWDGSFGDVEIPYFDIATFRQISDAFGDFLRSAELEGFTQDGRPNTLYLISKDEINSHIVNILSMVNIIGDIGGDDFGEWLAILGAVDDAEVSDFYIVHDREYIREINIIAVSSVAFGDIISIILGEEFLGSTNTFDNIFIPISFIINLDFDFNAGKVLLPVSYFCSN